MHVLEKSMTCGPWPALKGALAWTPRSCRCGWGLWRCRAIWVHLFASQFRQAWWPGRYVAGCALPKLDVYLIDLYMESVYLWKRKFFKSSIQGEHPFCPQILGGMQVLPSKWSMGAGLNLEPMQSVSNQSTGILRWHFDFKIQNPDWFPGIYFPEAWPEAPPNR